MAGRRQGCTAARMVLVVLGVTVVQPAGALLQLHARITHTGTLGHMHSSEGRRRMSWRQKRALYLRMDISDIEVDKKREAARRLQEMAQKAAEAALAAEKRAQEVKSGAMNELASIARREKIGSEKGRLRKEAEARAAEAARLAVDADTAEQQRGTSTLANRLAEQARVASGLAADAERRIAQLDGGLPQAAGVGVEAVAQKKLTTQSVLGAVSALRLIPVTSTRADVQRCTDALDALKAKGDLHLWNSVDADLSASGFRGASSAVQLRAATKIPDDVSLDLPLGLSSYRALQVKNYCTGSLMLAGGLGLILAGIAETTGALPLGVAGPWIETFGYGALTLNIVAGLFSDDTNNWLSKRLYQIDFQQYRKRAMTCEAAHFLVAYMSGLPLEEYGREHVGYPLKTRPTGRAQIYSTRRGDPEVSPRKRPFGLPPWASLDKDAEEDFLFGQMDYLPIKNGYTAKEMDRLSLVLLAAPVAEFMTTGSSSNGAVLYQQLDTCMLMAQDALTPSQMQSQVRWALIKVTALLGKNKKKLAALVNGMEREATLQELVAIIETTPD